MSVTCARYIGLMQIKRPTVLVILQSKLPKTSDSEQDSSFKCKKEKTKPSSRKTERSTKEAPDITDDGTSFKPPCISDFVS